jgi:hypothetical protein
MAAININVVRLLHVASALFNLAFIYTQLHDWKYGFGVVQFITMPLLIISGYLLVRHRKLLAK